MPVNDTPTENPAHDLNDQMKVRHAKRERLLAEGKQAYPVGVARTHSLEEVREQWGHLETGEETQDVVGIAGRVIFVRNTGKLCFATLQEGAGVRLQVMLSLAEVGEEALAEWKHSVDLGDHVFVEGRVISSRRGELSVMATRWEMASKALRPLPVLHHDLSEEARVRQRYADLIVRQEARDMVRTRPAIQRAVRTTLQDEGYLEIETPVLQLIHGGAKARPFRTHINAFDQEMTLRIALELNLKKAVVGGVDKVFEIGRIFRNEGVDSTHSPEFTMLEVYQAYGDQFTMADLMRADGAGRRRRAWLPPDRDRGRHHRPRRRVALAAGVRRGEPGGRRDGHAGHRRRDAAGHLTRHELEFDPAWEAPHLVMELLGELVEPGLLQPTFLCDYPPSAQPLARPHRSDPRLIEAWDLIIGGVERGTAFSELIDPVIQREVLTEQSRLAAAGDVEAMQLDEDFLRALEYGAPPMGGLGLGMDRLIMLFTGSGIRETILFPHLKPEVVR